MTTEKEEKPSFRLDTIPIDQCKLFEIEGQKVAVCHDPNDKFRFYKLEPVIKKKESV
ncbi:MAG: hypothetical protein ACTSRI_03980 [Promethearchaeota archaeon]